MSMYNYGMRLQQCIYSTVLYLQNSFVNLVKMMIFSSGSLYLSTNVNIARKIWCI